MLLKYQDSGVWIKISTFIRCDMKCMLISRKEKSIKKRLHVQAIIYIKKKTVKSSKCLQFYKKKNKAVLFRMCTIAIGKMFVSILSLLSLKSSWFVWRGQTGRIAEQMLSLVSKKSEV